MQYAASKELFLTDPKEIEAAVEAAVVYKIIVDLI